MRELLHLPDSFTVWGRALKLHQLFITSLYNKFFLSVILLGVMLIVVMKTVLLIKVAVDFFLAHKYLTFNLIL